MANPNDPVTKNPNLMCRKIWENIITDTSEQAAEVLRDAWVIHAQAMDVPEGTADVSMMFYQRKGIVLSVYAVGIRDPETRSQYTEPGKLLQDIIDEVKYQRPNQPGWFMVARAQGQLFIGVHVYRRTMGTSSILMILNPGKKPQSVQLTKEKMYEMLYRSIPGLTPKLSDELLETLISD